MVFSVREDSLAEMAYFADFPFSSLSLSPQKRTLKILRAGLL